MKVLIAGGGIGGLTLALALHQQSPEIEIEIFEAAREFKLLGLGINLMPHAIRALAELGLRDHLASLAVEAKEFAFYTHLGQRILGEPCGVHAGYEYPHFSVHRGDLHEVLYTAVIDRIGAQHVHVNHRLTGFEQDETGVRAHFTTRDGDAQEAWSGDVLIGCDGLHSAVRKAFYPDEGEPVFHGINMWRGVTRMKPFLTGASVTRIGALNRTGKIIVYPIRNNIDDEGNQLVNWVCEVLGSAQMPCDWSAEGKLEDFYHIYKDWTFDWLDVAGLIRNRDTVLSYPMVDRDPVSKWSFGRVTLLGDAAHAMYPRGGNGAAQSILDAGVLARTLHATQDPAAALREYEAMRLAPTTKIVLGNRTAPPDTLIELVEERTGGKRFDRLEDVVSVEELEAISHGYQRLAGYDKASVNSRV